MSEKSAITVGRLRAALAMYPDDAPLIFGNGDLRYSKVSNRGPVNWFEVQIEFSTLYEVTHDFSGE